MRLHTMRFIDASLQIKCMVDLARKYIWRGNACQGTLTLSQGKSWQLSCRKRSLTVIMYWMVCFDFWGLERDSSIIMFLLPILLQFYHWKLIKTMVWWCSCSKYMFLSCLGIGGDQMLIHGFLQWINRVDHIALSSFIMSLSINMLLFPGLYV